MSHLLYGYRCLYYCIILYEVFNSKPCLEMKTYLGLSKVHHTTWAWICLRIRGVKRLIRNYCQSFSRHSLTSGSIPPPFSPLFPKNPGIHKQTLQPVTLLTEQQRRLGGLGRVRYLSPHGEQGKHGEWRSDDRAMERCEGPFAPTTSCLPSSLTARWLPYTLSHTPQIHSPSLLFPVSLLR